MRLAFIFLLALAAAPVFAQKMLLLERANNPKPTKYYIGDQLHYRLTGQEDYWYERTITDMLPEKNTILLDNFPVQIGDISYLKVRRKGIWRIMGGTLFTFGVSLAFATTIAVLYKDDGTNFGALYATSAGSAGVGYYLSTRRKLKLSERHRLRLIEIDLPLLPPASRQ
jgi:hypothetical protein